jgi:hypothetical protein
MATTKSPPDVLAELAELFASGPSAEDVLRFHPSPQLQARAEELLDKLKEGCLSSDERREMDEFAYAEQLMRLTKARIRARQARKP